MARDISMSLASGAAYRIALKLQATRPPAQEN